jgi:isoquinoline 1-oxidoreductase subunit beta
LDTLERRERRDFLRVCAIGGTGLLLGFELRAAEGAPAASTPFAPNAYLRVAPDGSTTVIVGMSEMGQGVLTALPMLVAEELEADWAKVRVEQAPVDPAFVNSILGSQSTDGSASVRAFFEPLRKAGAAVREMLVAAAAHEWNVAPGECLAKSGYVVHRSGKRRSFGSLAQAAARQAVPANVRLKDPGEFTLLGKSGIRRLDTAGKVSGTAKYGIDVHVPFMLTALIARSPQIGGKAISHQPDAALAVPGVRKVIAISGGVAVLADTFWAAKKGRDALSVQWDPGPHAGLTSESIRRQYVDAAVSEGVRARDDGDVAPAFKSPGARLVDVAYEVPYLAHACMEPLNCTAWVRADEIDVWCGTQCPGVLRAALSRIHGVKPERVRVETMMLGGGFGRRDTLDLPIQAAELSKAAGVPVKLVYTREDDMRAHFYRPAVYAHLRAALDGAGRPLAMHAHTVSQSIFAAAQIPFKLNIDPVAVEGLNDWPYEMPDVRVEWSRAEAPVGVWFWRSVGYSHNTFFAEGLVDEMAVLAGKDPYEFRRGLLQKSPRHRAVLDKVATEARWGSPAPEGVRRGIALAAPRGSFVAQVVEASVTKHGEVHVHRVVCAVDCGLTVNPDIVRRQIEGAVVFALGAALHGRISIKDGQVEQGNFDAYPVLRMSETPLIQVHLIESREAPGGIGEVGVACLAPALVNAIYAASGVRLRRLPIDPAALQRA